MIAVDSSTLIDWLRGRDTRQTTWVDRAMDEERLFLPPPVEAELLSFPDATPELAATLDGIPRLEITEGYWARVGAVRRRLLSLGRKANLADAMIAQLCIDHGAGLITSDRDFRHFAEHCGLRLAD